MPLNDVGPRIYHQAGATATLSFSPQNDRAAVITRFLIDKVSAGDVWRYSCDGREIAAFDIQTFGNQQPLSAPNSAYPKNVDLFDMYNAVFNERLIFPVPWGTTATITSDGGATANILYEAQEYDRGEINLSMMNHPRGTRFILPLIGYVNATIAASGEAKFDTQVGPKWFPNIFVDNEIPPNWTFRILCMFLEGGGRNTFSGSADVQSTTSYLGIRKNGTIMYTRDALGGIPLIGQASATGSANTAVGTDIGPNPPFQESQLYDWEPIPPMEVLSDGDAYQFRLAVTGTFTGGADYSHMRQMFLCDVRTPG